MVILRYLIFFPSITFGVYDAEIFPYCLIFSLLFIAKIPISALYLIGTLLISCIYTHYTKEYNETDIIRSLAAYLNPIIIYYLLLNLNYRKIKNFERVPITVFISITIVGLLQYFSLINYVDEYIKYLIPRGHSDRLLEHGDRGVTLLSTEPARGGIEFIFLYIYIRKYNMPSSFRKFTDVLLLLYCLFILRSANVMLVYSFYLIINFRNKPLYIIGSLILSIFLFSIFDIGRLTALITLFNNANFDDKIWVLFNESGNRVITTFSFLIYGLENPFGGGIGNWKVSSIKALENTNIFFWDLRYFQRIYEIKGSHDTRGSGFIINLLLDLGIAGTLLIVYVIINFTRKYYKNIADYDLKTITFVFGFVVFFVGSVGAPVHWVVYALFLKRINYFKNV